jgi:succinate dehydrogenase / fumarate reductase, cytochrome b subunit
MTQKTRPTSPHLQIYKPQITTFTSILHRATGMFLYFGVVIICWAIVHYAYQIDIMLEGDQIVCDCVWEDLLKYMLYATVILWAFSLYYHLCNGIRHLFWDIGKGFEIKTARKTGYAAISAALILTVASVVFFIFFKMT